MITPAQEQEKYRRMWTEVPRYRQNSPGQRLVPLFLKQAAWAKDDTLIDLGCGSGRASMELREAGLKVKLLDITRTSLDPDVNFKVGVIGIPFIECCLWLPDVAEHGRFDWVYCCDVLEHIPPEHVDAVLDNIHALTTKGAFLQIALWPENFGNYIGEELHLTVESDDWWLEKITQRWPVEYQAPSGDGRLIVLTGAPLEDK